jgi:uncharacterized protein
MDLDPLSIVVLVIAFGAIAALYSAVGHGGATGYLALMALIGIAPAIARPGALWMNCFVAGWAFLHFRRAGYFEPKLFTLLGVASVPMAWWGSRLHLEGAVHATLLAVALAGAGVLLIRGAVCAGAERARPAPAVLLLGTGAGLGLLAGLTGIGGGVFLTPLLVLLRWSRTKSAGGTTAAFIVVNSIAGLIGLGERALVRDALLLIGPVAAILGAVVGARVGVERLTVPAFRRALAVVLWIAAAKLLLTAG